MDVEAAVKKIESMEHSEQHYFKRYVLFVCGIQASSFVLLTDPLTK